MNEDIKDSQLNETGQAFAEADNPDEASALEGADVSGDEDKPDRGNAPTKDDDPGEVMSSGKTEDPKEAGIPREASDSGEEKRAEPGPKKLSPKDPRDEKIEELQDRLKRQMAEFDNFRKRTEKEKSAMYEIGARDIIEKVLPVLDNFERGLAAVPEDEKLSSFAEGMAMTYKQFIKTLEDAGVETIEAEGKTFDPSLHNAVMHIDDEAYGDNEISQVLQKGYKYRGSVVRHSMVQVAN